jgi:hypothetical protein
MSRDHKEQMTVAIAAVPRGTVQFASEGEECLSRNSRIWDVFLRCRLEEGSDLCMRQREGDKKWPESGLAPTRGLELKP